MCDAALCFQEQLSRSRSKLSQKIVEMESFASNLEEIFITVEVCTWSRLRLACLGRVSSARVCLQENFGRQEQNLEQHYNEVLQTLSQRNEERAVPLDEQKNSKLERLYGQLLRCGRTLDTAKELIESAQELHRRPDKHAFLQVRDTPSVHANTTLQSYYGRLSVAGKPHL